MSRIETIGDCTLYLGDCREILPTLGKVDAVVTDPPYEAAMQDNWGCLLKNERAVSTHHNPTLGFAPIDEIRGEVARAIKGICAGWGIFFCMAEGVGAWRDAIETSGAKYKRAMVWAKPNPTPQFNGQGPGMGHEMLVSAWFGRGHSKWNGGGKAGNFYHVKNHDGEHPTQKPLPLMEELVSLFSFPASTVADPFMGSGTTGVACVKLGRKFIGIEIEPKYFDIARHRIADEVARPRLPLEEPAAPKQEAML